ncbi:MAG TPA: DUF3817 domain-containing protein [Verrucomicrobiae bacterium]
MRSVVKNPVALLRNLALIEGISWLVLLFVAMPLKYIWDRPEAVRVVGMAHGILFCLLCAWLLYTSVAAKWPLSRAGLIFLAALIPFGPWLVDRRMKSYEAEYSAEKSA